MGGVTAREKPAGYAFTESDFLPAGTRPGVVGGTPQGKRAITLDASKLKGAHDLSEGDHLDLLASVSVDMPGAGHSGSGRLGNNVVATPDMAFLPKRSLVRALVQDGVVVTPVRIRNVPISSSSFTQGTTMRTMPVEEIVLAVDPKEVAPLAEAMDLKYEITCVARSGRPAAVLSPPPQPAAGGLSEVFAALGQGGYEREQRRRPGQGCLGAGKMNTVNRPKTETPAKDPAARDITPGLDPMAQTRYMEVIIGGQRQFMLFTGPGNSPVVRPKTTDRPRPLRGKRASNRRIMKTDIGGKAADRAGYALVLFVMIFFGLMGLAALVIDMGFARLAQRQMQTAVDSAALEGLRWRDGVPRRGIRPAIQLMPPSSLLAALRRKSPTTRAIRCGRLGSTSASLGSQPGGCRPVHRLRGRQRRDGAVRRRAGRDFQRRHRRHGRGANHDAGGPAGYQPTGLQFNLSNGTAGDMVAGTYGHSSSYDATQPADEYFDYNRRDFTPSSGTAAPRPGLSGPHAPYAVLQRAEQSGQHRGR